jgi:hypothetical protein
MHKSSISIIPALLVVFCFLLLGTDNSIAQQERLKVDGKPAILEKKPSETLKPAVDTKAEQLKINKEALKPDLILVNPNNIVNNCTTISNNAWKFRIFVKNQGRTASTPCTTNMTFWVTVPNTTTSTPKTITIPTPVIQPGQTVEIGPVDIPITCFRPDCIFKITVDSTNQVNETNENNNIMEGLCIG